MRIRPAVPNPRALVLALVAGACLAGCSPSKSPLGTTIGGGGSHNTPFDSGLHTPPHTFEHVFPDPGEVIYHCVLHAGMVGRVEVDATAPAVAETVLVGGIANAFSPDSVRVHTGGRVVWQWVGGNHSVTTADASPAPLR